MEPLERPADRLHHPGPPRYGGWEGELPRKHAVVSLCLTVSLPSPSEWCPGSEGYILSSRRNIALRSDSAHTRCPVLYSNAPTYFCGQTLTFKYVRTLSHCTPVRGERVLMLVHVKRFAVNIRIII